jgi:hypothetical protein
MELSYRKVNIIDNFARECLMANAVRRFSHSEIMGHLTDLFCEHAVPMHIRSDIGPERSTIASLEAQGQSSGPR